MQCTNGHEVPDTQAFCGECGAQRLSSSLPPPTPALASRVCLNGHPMGVGQPHCNECLAAAPAPATPITSPLPPSANATKPGPLDQVKAFSKASPWKAAGICFGAIIFGLIVVGAVTKANQNPISVTINRCYMDSNGQPAAEVTIKNNGSQLLLASTDIGFSSNGTQFSTGLDVENIAAGATAQKTITGLDPVPASGPPSCNVLQVHGN